MKREIEIHGNKIDVLRVPWYSQSDTDWLCTIYSLKMVMDFYKNIHPNSKIRESVPNTDRDELVEITKSELGTGTAISDELIAKLRDKFPQYNFSLEEVTFTQIQKSFEADKPVIVVYNPSYLFIGEKGPGHAGVVIGITDQYVILNNPWYGQGFFVPKTDFERCWELEYNWAIFIEPNKQRRLTDAEQTS